jgi:enoyl-CoA hydratase
MTPTCERGPCEDGGMDALVTCVIDGHVAMITMDDGKANVLSPAMQSEIHEALDRAQSEQAIVVLNGRDGCFSGGFDLAVLRSGGSEASGMLRGGFDLAERMLTFPRPVIAACTGHAIAMGVFLLLSADYRIGAEGRYKITANEVAIGMTLPRSAIEILRQRLTPAAFTRASILAEVFSPANAVDCGFLDEVVSIEELAAASLELANRFSMLDARAHADTKQRVRMANLEAFRTALKADLPDFGITG